MPRIPVLRYCGPLCRGAFICLMICLAPARSELALPAVFSNSMVLQRDKDVPVWGTALPGDTIEVTVAGQADTAVTAEDSTWRVVLDSVGAGRGACTLSVRGPGDTLTFTDVLFGDVWVCAGQSNMVVQLSGFQDTYNLNVETAGMAEVRYLNFRVTTDNLDSLPFPYHHPWRVLDNAVMAYQLCAAGFFFGREIYQSQGVPVGLIEVALGESSVESWLDSTAVAGLSTILWDSSYCGQPVGANFKFVRSLMPFAIRGVVWYQGEANAVYNTGHTYWSHFTSLIGCWRRAWEQGDFPFYYVQLANITPLQTSPQDTGAWPAVREAQRLALSEPNTGMAVAIDIGEADSFHPRNKLDIGRRLGRIARALEYGEDSLAYSGPLFAGAYREDGAIVLHFSHIGGGLVSHTGDTLAGFAIAGYDSQYVWADAAISGDSIIVSSPLVSLPAAVRYGWANNPLISLYNQDSLPASPFQTQWLEEPVVGAVSPGKSLMAPRVSGRTIFYNGGNVELKGLPPFTGALSVYDINGIQVYTSTSEEEPFVWDGRDKSGVPAEPGVYIAVPH